LERAIEASKIPDIKVRLAQGQGGLDIIVFKP
jgi:hypothetical protein